MLPTIHMPLQMFGCKNLCLNDLQLVLGGVIFRNGLKENTFEYRQGCPCRNGSHDRCGRGIPVLVYDP